MLKVTSEFEGTAIVPATTAGTYYVVAGDPITFSAGQTHPESSFSWDLGDGTTQPGASVTHVYSDDGFYVVKLTVIVNQAGGALTREFGAVHVRKAPIKVDLQEPGPVNEGDEFSISAKFEHAEWTDKHTAIWNWGDGTGETVGQVFEVNEPPLAHGVIEGTHAWGDNGKYLVQLIVRDEDGGFSIAQVTVTVLNVPPKVDAGVTLFSYPGHVITRMAKFEDPGWLDTHVARWHFGDGSDPLPAVVYEDHDPPTGVGVAIASHVYADRGDYICQCSVVDDDGGLGSSITITRVVSLNNPDFEDGFYELPAGVVANGWSPYAATVPSFLAASKVLPVTRAQFLSQTIVEKQGRRSQGIEVPYPIRAGIQQCIGANPGWVYQVAVWYALSANSTIGGARLGIDPQGGTDPTAASIVWSEGRKHGPWHQLVGRVCADGKAITIFLEAYGARTPPEEVLAERKHEQQSQERAPQTLVWFDQVRLIPMQPALCSVVVNAPEDGQDDQKEESS